MAQYLLIILADSIFRKEVILIVKSFDIIKRIKIVIGLVVALLVTGAVETWAVPIAPGALTPIGGTTWADRPELAGTVIVDDLISFTGKDALGNIYYTGILQTRIVRETVAGTLDFYYRIRDLLPGPSYTDGITRLSTTDFAGFATDVDWRIDGLGSVSPVIADRSSSGSKVSFTFYPGTLMPGTESMFMFIKTNATHYGIGSTVLIDGGIASIKTYAPIVAPVPEPSTLLLLGSGLLGLGLFGRKMKIM